MLALIRMPTSMPEPSASRLQFTPTPVVIVIAVPSSIVDGNHSRTSASSVISMSAADAATPMASASRRARRFVAARVEHDERFAGRHAVGVGQLLVDDEVLPHRHRQQHAKQASDGEPGERLQRLSVVEKATFGLAASMSNAASRMHMKAVCAPAVPAVCTMLFSQRL